jgi:hypothetical protein
VQRRQLRELQTVLDLLPSPSDFFVSYRRGQSEPAANTLREGLARRFGEEHVFMDTDAIDPGEEWPRRIVDAIESCRAMLVVIGPQWLEARGQDASRRPDDPGDWVRRGSRRASAPRDDPQRREQLRTRLVAAGVPEPAIEARTLADLGQARQASEAAQTPVAAAPAPRAATARTANRELQRRR